MRTVWEYAGADGSAVLVRLYGADGSARLPERLGGLPLTAVGPYCFSGEEIPPRFRRQDVKRCEEGEAFLEGEEPAPLRGGRLKALYLPDTVREVGDYCFYGCGSLETLGFSEGLLRTGNGAFMGCDALKRLEYQTTGDFRALSRVLSDVRGTVKVSVHEGGKEFSLVFPGYYEASVENIPARIFEVHFRGTGYRYRQCFRDGRLELSEYDGLFSLAAGQEEAGLLAGLSACRLSSPEGLSPEARERYLDWLGRHVREAAPYLLKEAEPETLRLLAEAGAFDREAEPEPAKTEKKEKKLDDGAGDFYMASLGEDIVEKAAFEKREEAGERREDALDVLTDLAARSGNTEAVSILMDHRYQRGKKAGKKSFVL